MPWVRFQNFNIGLGVYLSNILPSKASYLINLQYRSDKSASQLKNNSLKGWEPKIDDSVLFPVKSNYIFC